MAARAPLLAEAVHHIAHPQIRNRGTVGGSLAHADPKAELPALAVTLQARLHLQRQGSERWVDAADFYTGWFSTDLGADELLTEVVWPALPARSGGRREAARRHGDYAQVGVRRWAARRRGALRVARLVLLAGRRACGYSGRGGWSAANGRGADAAAAEAAAAATSRAATSRDAGVQRHLARY